MIKLGFAALAVMIIFYLSFVRPGVKKKRHEPTLTNDIDYKDHRCEPKVEHRKIRNLCTENERLFLIALKQVLPDSYMVHCQTSLMAIVQPTQFKDNSKTWAKRMDFVITDGFANIKAVVELNDKSHQRRDRQKRDRYVESVLEGHHTLIRFEAQSSYEPTTIAKTISLHMDLD